MTDINITFSYNEGGSSLGDVFDLGTGGFNGNNPDPVDLWIRHDGDQPLTNAKLYVANLSAFDYTGVANPQDDYDSVVEYTGNVFGRIYIDIGDGNGYQLITTDVGGSLETALILGTIPQGDSGVMVTIKFVFDNEIADIALGKRQLDLRLTYSFTI